MQESKGQGATQQHRFAVQAAGRNRSAAFADAQFEDQRDVAHSFQAVQRLADTRPAAQRQKAYDAMDPEDPRHFSQPAIRNAVNSCRQNNTLVPGWLKDKLSDYLRDELSERHADLQRYNGGDQEHNDYFDLIKDYVVKVEALNGDDDVQIPTDARAIQLRSSRPDSGSSVAQLGKNSRKRAATARNAKKKTTNQSNADRSYDNLCHYRGGWIKRNSITVAMVKDFRKVYSQGIRGHASGSSDDKEQQNTTDDCNAYKSWHTKNHGPWK